MGLKKNSRGKCSRLSHSFAEEPSKLARQALATGAISIEALYEKLSNPAVRTRLARALNENPVKSRLANDQDFLSAYEHLLSKKDTKP